MDLDDNYKEVRFDIYCVQCKHRALPETQNPCNECLEYGSRQETFVPINFKKNTK